MSVMIVMKCALKHFLIRVFHKSSYFIDDTANSHWCKGSGFDYSKFLGLDLDVLGVKKNVENGLLMTKVTSRKHYCIL